LVNQYRRADGALIHHLDAYRLDSPREAEDLDLEFMMSHGVLIVEWPERIGDLVPAQRLWIQFEHLDDNQRAIRFAANGARYEQLLAGIV
jgi:tRNA threonylcarbamoyl adenosine modification protein YjeE